MIDFIWRLFFMWCIANLCFFFIETTVGSCFIKHLTLSFFQWYKGRLIYFYKPRSCLNRLQRKILLVCESHAIENSSKKEKKLNLKKKFENSKVVYKNLKMVRKYSDKIGPFERSVAQLRKKSMKLKLYHFSFEFLDFFLKFPMFI